MMFILYLKLRLCKKLNRFFVEYEIFSKDKIEVKDIANSIAIEETVEIPEDIIPDGFIKNKIVGKVENVKKQSNNSYSVKISYSEKCVGNEILQLLNVIHGNSSMFNNVKVLDIEFNKNLSSIFPGPKFGIQGLRKIFNHRIIFFLHFVYVFFIFDYFRIIFLYFR